MPHTPDNTHAAPSRFKSIVTLISAVLIAVSIIRPDWLHQITGSPPPMQMEVTNRMVTVPAEEADGLVVKVLATGFHNEIDGIQCPGERVTIELDNGHKRNLHSAQIVGGVPLPTGTSYLVKVGNSEAGSVFAPIAVTEYPNTIYSYEGNYYSYDYGATMTDDEIIADAKEALKPTLREAMDKASGIELNLNPPRPVKPRGAEPIQQ